MSKALIFEIQSEELLLIRLDIYLLIYFQFLSCHFRLTSIQFWGGYWSDAHARNYNFAAITLLLNIYKLCISYCYTRKPN